MENFIFCAFTSLGSNKLMKKIITFGICCETCNSKRSLMGCNHVFNRVSMHYVINVSRLRFPDI